MEKILNNQNLSTYGYQNGHAVMGESLHTIGGSEAKQLVGHFVMSQMPNGVRIKKAMLKIHQNSAMLSESNAKMGVYWQYYELGSASFDDNISELVGVLNIQQGEVDYSVDITKMLRLCNKYHAMQGSSFIIKMMDDNTQDSAVICGSNSDNSPEISIEYENAYGVNENYRTHSFELGNRGNIGIDLVGGNVTMMLDDFVWSGNRMPVTLRHMYTSALKNNRYTANENIALNVADFSFMKLGLGFRISAMQSMVPLEFIHKGETISGYIYTDETGDEILFKEKGENEYCDIDNDECVYNSATRTLTIGDEKHLFDESGRLIGVADSHNNSMSIVYSDGQITQIIDGAGREFLFSYTDGFLNKIVAPDSSYTEYTYYADGRLQDVFFSSGEAVRFEYYGANEAAFENMPKSIVFYDIGGSTVNKYTFECGGKDIFTVSSYGADNSVGSTVKYSYNTCENTMTVDYTDDAGTINTKYFIDQNLDIVAETVHTESDGIMAGNGFAPNMQDNAGVITSKGNLLTNHSFELFENWSVTDENAQMSVIETPEALYGSRVLELKTLDNFGAANGINTTINLPAGTYTFSAYVKAVDGFENTNNGVYLSATDSDGKILGVSEISNITDTFIRLVLPITLDIDETVTLNILANGQGSAYIDGACLENNPYANEYNLLQNSSFEGGMYKWDSEGAVEASDNGVNNNHCVKIDANGTVSQRVNVKSAADIRESFTLSGWANANGIPTKDAGNTFRLRAEFTYTDGTVSEQTEAAEFICGADGWQYASAQIAKDKFLEVDYLTVYCEFTDNMDIALFDDISLTRQSIEEGLTEEDFAESDEDTEDTTTENGEADTADNEFKEAVDEFGNNLTETVFNDTDFGTMYKGYGYSFDGNNLVVETDNRGNVTQYDVESETSRNKSITDAEGNVTEYGYDASGRTTKIVSKDNQNTEQASVEYKYDGGDNMTEILRGDGLKYVLQYNAYKKLESIGIGGKDEKLIKYTYKTSSGRLKELEYANGDKMSATYNGIGQMIAEKWTDSDGNITAMYRYTYDGNGNIVRSIDIKAKKEYNYEYTEGTLTRSTECDIILNDSGYIIYKTLICSTIYVYKNSELIKKIVTFKSGDRQEIQYTEQQEITAQGSESAINTTKGEDEKTAELIHTKIGNTQFTAKSETDGFGRKSNDEIKLEKGFVSREFRYLLGEVTEQHSENEKLESTPTTQLVQSIALSDGRTLSYEYDRCDRITKVTDSTDKTVKYTYDSLGQLLTETVNGVVINSMTYDNYGNILTKNGAQYVYGDSKWRDKLTAVDGKSIAYDNQGNPTTYLGHTLTWEKGRQLKSFDDKSYTYNANGIRTSKTVDDIQHKYILDGAKILREAWGDNYITPLYDNEDAVCGIIYNNNAFYFLKNLQGDIITITDKKGEPVAKYTYDAWGVPTISMDKSGVGIATINPFRYRGYYYDQETGLYYLQSRYYNPEVARFVNSDKAEYFNTNETAISCNLFAYCENNPVNLKDILGGFSWSIFPKIINRLTSLVGKLSDFLLNTFGISRKKYAHKLKYNNADSLMRFVNNNKSKIKKIGRSFSAIANSLEILIICFECYSRIKKHLGKSNMKTLASLAFYGVVSIIGKIVSKLVSWILSKVIVAFFWARFIIQLIIDTIVDWILSAKWVSRIETKFVQIFDKNKITIGYCFINLFKATKAVCA